MPPHAARQQDSCKGFVACRPPSCRLRLPLPSGVVTPGWRKGLNNAIDFGGRTIKATPGTMVFLPRDVVHSFAIESDQMRVLVLVAPAGLEGWFKEFSVPAPAMTLPPTTEVPYSEIQKMLAAAPKYGLEFVLPKP
jgi:hypothetical protein